MKNQYVTFARQFSRTVRMWQKDIDIVLNNQTTPLPSVLLKQHVDWLEQCMASRTAQTEQTDGRL